jgi:glucose/mannose-6-phosphate isomerase
VINLDSSEDINRIDRGGVLSSIVRLHKQFEQSWQEINKLAEPKECSLANNVVIAGMGGSALGGRIVDFLSEKKIRVPVEVFTQYYLPNYVNKNSLVIVSSYSGNTEEALYCANHALNNGAKIFGITTGGKLGELLKENNTPCYIIDAKENPCGQPRMALGYSIGSILAILSKCSFISLSNEEVISAIKDTDVFVKEFGVDQKERQNLAKTYAKRLHNRIPVLVSSEHLIGACHAFKNQLNEGSKTFSIMFDIPELNHHLMEGLRNPLKIRDLLCFLFFESNLYSNRVKMRYSVTKEVVEKNGIKTLSYIMRSQKKLNQIFELLVFGSFVHFYLAMIYGINPLPIPWVDYFKKKLS